MLHNNNSVLFLLILVLNVANIAFTLDNGLALTPPMGWLTWQRFRCNTDCTNDPENCISEHLIKVMADRMVDDGYLKAGYEYIIVDDCWLAPKRDANNRLQPDPVRFPSGIRALADYVHAKGLKFGIYEDYGTLTCGGYPGSIDHLQLDAETFADWTVDYVKLDGCYADVRQMDDGYPLMSYYLNQTQRPMVYSCSWPAYQVFDNIEPNYTRIAEYCNLWRNYGDIDDSWDSVKSIADWYVSQYGNMTNAHGPGHWNDPDMLIIGNYGLSYGQSQTQMAIWSILSAPLVMSVDLRTIEPWAKDILQNENLLAINQDMLGVMGKVFNTMKSVTMWSKPLTYDRTAFVFMYPLPYGTPVGIDITLNKLGLIRYTSYNFYESFSGKLIGTYRYDATFSCNVNPSGSVFAFWAEPVKTVDGQDVQALPYSSLSRVPKKPLFN